MRTVWCVLALTGPISASAADDDLISAKDVKAQAEKPTEGDDAVPEGWSKSLSLGANAAFNDSRKVVGQADGSTFQLGVLLQGAANRHRGPTDWENALTFGLTETKTPSVKPLVKTLDNLQLSSNYYYSLPKPDWIGPFVRVGGQSQVLRGSVVFPGDTALQYDGAVDGSGAPITTLLPAQEKAKLTGAFEPIALRQSLGAFARPVQKKGITARVTIGLGAQEIVARSGYALADDAATTDRVEVTTIPSSVQAGAEAQLDAAGALNDTISYTLLANTLYPFAVTGDTTLKGAQLANVTVDGKISIKLAKWASLDYVVGIKRVPLVVDAWQVQNGLLLSSAFQLIKSEPPAPDAADAPPAPTDPAATPTAPATPTEPATPPAPATPTEPATPPAAPPTDAPAPVEPAPSVPPAPTTPG